MKIDISLCSFGVFSFTYLYILVKIGVRNFQWNDTYKIFFPIYLIVFFGSLKSKIDVFILMVNILSLILWVRIAFWR